MKKFLCTLFAIVCVISFACACSTEGRPSPSPTDEITSSPSVTSTPGTSSATIADFTIIYPANDFVSKEIAFNLRTSFLTLGNSLKMRDDTIDEENGYTEDKYEILIGETNRNESSFVIGKTTLRTNDYIIKFVNDKLVVHAGSKDGYSLAIDKLLEICTKDNSVEAISNTDIYSRFGNSPDGFFIDGVSLENFKIVSSLTQMGNDIIKKIFETTGYTLSLGDVNTPSEYEILIGDVQRDEVTKAKKDLRDLDYAVKTINGKMVIVGGSNSMTENAYNFFVSEVLDTKADKKEFISDKNDIVYRHEYPLNSVKLVGCDISEYVILAKKENDRAAMVIREYINDLTGIKLDIVTDGTYEKAIILGNVGTKQYKELTVDLKKDEYIIKNIGTKIYLGTVGNDEYYEDGPAVHKFIENYLGYDFSTGKVKNTAVEINEINNTAKIDDYLMKIADSDFLAEINAKAENLKSEILNSKTDITYTGTAYYVSNNGNDENDGLTPETAWATLSRVTHATELKSGDAVLFNRGDIFRGTLGTVKGVTYSAYGEGVKPRIWQSPVDGAVEYDWIEVAPDVWKYTYDFGYKDIGAVILNHGEKIAFKICPNYTQTPVLNNLTNEAFSYKTMNTHDMYFYCSTDEEFSPLVDTEFGYLYMCCKAGKPSDIFNSIEFNVNGHIVYAEDDTTIDNLCVQYGGDHGINAGRMHCTIQNCEVSYIGGCYQGNGDDVRYGNGIELWGSGYDFTVRNSYIHHCYDAGITNQGGSSYSNIYYYNNLLEYSMYNIEYWNSDNLNSNLPTTNMLIYDNIMRYAGCALDPGRADGFNGFNIVATGYSEQIDCGVYNNIFMHSHKWLIRNVCQADASWLLPYYDNTFIEYEGGYVGSAANTTGDKHGVWSDFNYSGIDSWEYRKNTFYMVER